MFFMRKLTLNCFKTGKRTDEKLLMMQTVSSKKNQPPKKTKTKCPNTKKKKSKPKIYPPFYVIHHHDELKPDHATHIMCYVCFFSLWIALIFSLTQNLQ